ncbi:hypothetical protein BYT27DRAFT_6787300 [Phlegmacium glaucopus]|nr:hypothetical protein BYT27DRAFT_6787300 [Phlegmacium glaucopus]
MTDHLCLMLKFNAFKVHRTLLSRHSRFFASLSTPQETSGSDFTTSDSPTMVQTHAFDHIVLEQRKEVKAEDVEALLQPFVPRCVSFHFQAVPGCVGMSPSTVIKQGDAKIWLGTW